MLLSCSGPGPDAGAELLSSKSAALTQAAPAAAGPTINITGTVTDPLTGPQAGITITLSVIASSKLTYSTCP